MRYEANDGCVFDTAEEAGNHELQLKFNFALNGVNSKESPYYTDDFDLCGIFDFSSFSKFITSNQDLVNEVMRIKETSRANSI
jgi:hypothetical protein